MDNDAFLLSLLASGLARCGAVATAEFGLLSSLFVTGLIGGVTHCTGMCGPFVLSQVSARLAACPASRMSEWRRLGGAALLPYHLGRATTYAGLGALAASAAGGLMAIGGLRWLAAALLVAGALLLLAMALPSLKSLLPGGAGDPGWWHRSVGRVATPLFARPTGWRGWLLGVCLGFIPCGLLYGALAIAAASGTALAGALAMLAFTAGTVPTLFAVGLVGHMAARRWRTALLHWAPLLLFLNAGVLTWMAWRLVA